MEPVTAVLLSLAAAWAIVRAAWDAGVDQAKAEARHAAAAIREDLRARRAAWAKELHKRLDEGRKGGPSTALWWGWAALRTARAVRRMLRREPREAEKRSIRGTTGPFWRIWEASWRGARFAWDEARRQREAHEKRTRIPLRVCARCGVVAAKSALVFALTRFGRMERMCAKCRAAVDAERKADKEAAKKPEQTAPEPADADVIVTPPPSIERPRRRLDPPREGRDGSRTPEHTPPAQPKAPELSAPRPHTPQPLAAPQRPAIDPPKTEGEPMPRSLVPRTTASGLATTREAAMVRRGGGDSYTHGQWNRATADIHRRLAMLPALLEAMLASLNHASAGRAQVAGVMAFHEDAVNLIGEIRHMLREVNRRGIPMVEAVTAAGGPDEIPDLGYFREI